MRAVIVKVLLEIVREAFGLKLEGKTRKLDGG